MTPAVAERLAKSAVHLRQYKRTPAVIAKQQATYRKRKAAGMYADRERGPLSPEHCAALSKARVGKKHSAATKTKIAATVKKQHDKRRDRDG